MSAEAVENLICMLQDEWWDIQGGDTSTLARLLYHVRILCGTRFASRSMHTFTTSLEYVAERYSGNDALVHAAIPCLIKFERITRAQTPCTPVCTAGSSNRSCA